MSLVFKIFLALNMFFVEFGLICVFENQRKIKKQAKTSTTYRFKK